jgi:tRNA(His) 5'-end guanylyltransferase
MNLSDRMKDYYENRAKTSLLRRTPVIIRLDGKAFHTFTKGFVRPFDKILSEAMQLTMKYLCEQIQGCVLGYTQSDEITLVLVDYKTLKSEMWFDGEVQKICSTSASLATMYFNKIFRKLVNSSDANVHQKYIYQAALDRGAMFDSRCFNIPKEEVTNCFLWRQRDAIRNSIQMVGQTYFHHYQLEGKSCEQIVNDLIVYNDIKWEDFPIMYQRGSCCIKEDDGWKIDKEIPIFVQDGRQYIEKLINYEV